MKKLSKIETIRLFRLHWQSIGIEGSEEKDSNWFIKRKKDLLYDCYLCEYVIQKHPEIWIPTMCRYCPIKWPIFIKNEDIAPCEQSFFGLWNQLPYGEIRNKIALLISELPEVKK